MKIDLEDLNSIFVVALFCLFIGCIGGCVTYYGAHTEVHAARAACEARYAELRKHSEGEK